MQYKLLVKQVNLTYHPAGAGKAVAHGAALPLGGHHFLTVRQDLTLNLVADDDAVVADAHLTRLGFPDVVVMIDLIVDCAFLPFLLIWSCNTGQ